MKQKLFIKAFLLAIILIFSFSYTSAFTTIIDTNPDLETQTNATVGAGLLACQNFSSSFDTKIIRTTIKCTQNQGNLTLSLREGSSDPSTATVLETDTNTSVLCNGPADVYIDLDFTWTTSIVKDVDYWVCFDSNDTHAISKLLAIDTYANHQSYYDGSYFDLDYDVHLYAETTSIVNTFISPTGTTPTNNLFTIKTSLAYASSGLNVADADVNFNFNNVGWVSATYSAVNEWYSYDYNSPIISGDYNFAVISGLSNVNGDYDEYSINVTHPEYLYLTFTPIENIANWNYGSIKIIPADNDEQIIFKIDSNSNITESPNFIIRNYTNDKRQYFIYQATQSQYENGTWVFNDSLTFGITESNPIQKIWKEEEGTNGLYEHSYTDSISAKETKYYKLTYALPYKHWYSIKNNIDWFETLKPQKISDTNSIIFDSYQISKFSNIRSIYIPEIPDIFDGETAAFEFQFTAWSDTANTLISAGITLNESDTTTDVNLGLTPTRYSFTIDALGSNDRQLLLKTTNSASSATVYITDYAIVARKFFTKKLDLLQENGEVLKSILLSLNSEQYLQEGKKFRITTQAYDRDGLLKTIEVEAFLDGNAANDKVSKETIDVYDEDFPNELKKETIINFDNLFEKIIDLNGNATTPSTPRNLIVQATLTDTNNNGVSLQSKTVKFLQYPYFPQDLQLQFFPTEKRRGKHPAGLIEIIIKESDTLEAIDLRIWDVNTSVDNPDYKEILYKGPDFICTNGICSFEIKINDWLFEDTNLNTISIIARMNTETLDLNNILTRTDRRIFISQIEYDIAKVYQVVERGDNTYRNDEEIPLVLILRDSEATDLKEKINVYLTLQNCDSNVGTPNCVDQTIKWKPTGHLYSDVTSVNYFYFRHLFVLDNGSLLPDGNFISFKSHVEDKTGARNTFNPLLASKCFDRDWIAEFLANPIAAIDSFIQNDLVNTLSTGLTGYGFTPCNTDQKAIITTATNTDQKDYLAIDEDHSTTPPTQEGFICISPDSNNVITESFKQDIICGVLYTVGEKPIDNFRLRIGNSNSNYANEENTKQYLEFNLPYELIATNDIFLLKEQLEAGRDGEITTIGEFLYESFREHTLKNSGTQLVTNYADFVLNQGTITNIGGDINLNQAFSVNNITGAYIINIKGLPVINAQDYRKHPKVETDFENIPIKSFVDYLAKKGVSTGKKEAKAEIFVSDIKAPYPISSNGVLVINELPSQKINQNNLDENANKNYNFIPKILRFNLQNSMFYNNFSQTETLSGTINIFVIIRESAGNAFLDWLELLQKFTEDPFNTLGEIINGSINFLAENLIYIMILLGMLTSIGIVVFLFSAKNRGR